MFSGIGYQEILVIGVVAILLFGKRLPDVARSWGQSYREFRRSVNEIKSSFTNDHFSDSSKPRRAALEYDDRIQDSTPRFVPPPSEESTPETQSASVRE